MKSRTTSLDHFIARLASYGGEAVLERQSAHQQTERGIAFTVLALIRGGTFTVLTLVALAGLEWFVEWLLQALGFATYLVPSAMLFLAALAPLLAVLAFLKEGWDLLGGGPDEPDSGPSGVVCDAAMQALLQLRPHLPRSVLLTYQWTPHTSRGRSGELNLRVPTGEGDEVVELVVRQSPRDMMMRVSVGERKRRVNLKREVIGVWLDESTGRRYEDLGNLAAELTATVAAQMPVRSAIGQEATETLRVVRGGPRRQRSALGARVSTQLRPLYRVRRVEPEPRTWWSARRGIVAFAVSWLLIALPLPLLYFAVTWMGSPGKLMADLSLMAAGVFGCFFALEYRFQRPSKPELADRTTMLRRQRSLFLEDEILTCEGVSIDLRETFSLNTYRARLSSDRAVVIIELVQGKGRSRDGLSRIRFGVEAEVDSSIGLLELEAEVALIDPGTFAMTLWPAITFHASSQGRAADIDFQAQRRAATATGSTEPIDESEAVEQPDEVASARS